MARVQTNKKPFDFILFITVLILLAMGIVMLLSASSPTALAESGNSYAYVSRQAVFAVLGIGLMLFISNLEYHDYEKLARIAYIGSVIVLALVPLLGSSAKGATRWLEIGGIRFQPSEVAKIALIIFYASWLTKNKEQLKDLKNGFFRAFSYLIPIAIILIVFQDHLSVTIIIIAVVSLMMLMAGCKMKHFLTIGTIGGVLRSRRIIGISKIYRKGSLSYFENYHFPRPME